MEATKDYWDADALWWKALKQWADDQEMAASEMAGLAHEARSSDVRIQRICKTLIRLIKNEAAEKERQEGFAQWLLEFRTSRRLEKKLVRL